MACSCREFVGSVFVRIRLEERRPPWIPLARNPQIGQSVAMQAPEMGSPIDCHRELVDVYAGLLERRTELLREQVMSANGGVFPAIALGLPAGPISPNGAASVARTRAAGVVAPAPGQGEAPGTSP